MNPHPGSVGPGEVGAEPAGAVGSSGSTEPLDVTGSVGSTGPAGPTGLVGAEEQTTGTPEPTSPSPGRVRARIGAWLVGFWALSILVGAAVGVVWEGLAPLPSYTVGSNGVASTSERGLADMFGSDAWFCLLGFCACVGLGLIAWRWFHPLGWPTVPVAITGALAAALVCCWVGYRLGPSSFVERLAAAKPGDVVAVQLTLKTKASLVIWAFGAVIPILLRSSLGRDEEDAAAQETSAR